MISAFFWRRYSVAIDRLNKNPLNVKFAKDNNNVPTFPSRVSLWLYISHEILLEQPIDYLEFGVFEGDSIREWCRLNKSTDSRFYGFDTFTGMPEDWIKGFERGAFSTQGKVPKIEDERVNLIKGLFQETLYDFLKKFRRKNRMVIHIDADLYSSALFVLFSLHYHLMKDDIIIFDDFLDPIGEFKAFNDYCQAFKVHTTLLAAVKSGKLIDKCAFLF